MIGYNANANSNIPVLKRLFFFFKDNSNTILSLLFS